MGTNWYLMSGKTVKKTCPCCGMERDEQEMWHIGKSSFGRYFTLHEIDEEDLKLDCIKDWMSFIEKTVEEGGKIVNEYGKEATPAEIRKTIAREDWASTPKAGQPGEPYGFGDVWGERGLIHSRGAKLGEDGLYVVFAGDFS